MSPDGVVVASPALDDDPGLFERVEDFAVQKLARSFELKFSRIALVNSAFNIARRLKPIEQRSEIRAPGE